MMVVVVGRCQALKECHKVVSSNLDSLENELADKIGKQQRARMSSLQACRFVRRGRVAGWGVGEQTHRRCSRRHLHE